MEESSDRLGWEEVYRRWMQAVVRVDREAIQYGMSAMVAPYQSWLGAMVMSGGDLEYALATLAIEVVEDISTAEAHRVRHRLKTYPPGPSVVIKWVLTFQKQCQIHGRTRRRVYEALALAGPAYKERSEILHAGWLWPHIWDGPGELSQVGNRGHIMRTITLERIRSSVKALEEATTACHAAHYQVLLDLHNVRDVPFWFDRY